MKKEKLVSAKGIVLALLLSLAGKGMCQLRSEGAVPADLKMSFDELYNADLKRAESYAGGKVKNKEPLKEASYHVGKMMAGGRIVYGDPVSRMLGRIADTLLKEYPDLRRELRFYTVKSPEVNAFATGQGMVFVNAGLVAQVENEAQLAFVLSHEIVHYYRNHSMEELVGDNKSKKRNSDKERIELGQFLKRHNRSHAMESEADSLGITMFYMDSPYDKGVADGVFDVLQYSELPFDDVPFDTAWFNTPYYRLSGCWLEKTADITSRDDYDDSRSSHPNILTRRRNCAETFAGRSGGARFVVTTSEEFAQVRHLARLECIRQELVYGEYSRAFYNTWVMLRDNPDDAVLNRYLAQSLYGIAMAKIHNGTNSVTGDYNKVEGESQQVYYAMRNMSCEQAALAALHTVWNLHRRFPAEKVYVAMSDDLIEAMRSQLKMSAADFMSTPPSADTADAANTGETRAMTKYERIKQKKQVQTGRSQYAYALTDIMMADESLGQKFKAKIEKPADNTVKDDTSAILVYSPSYWVVNDRNDKLDVARSDDRERDLTMRIVTAGKRLGRQSVDFSDAGLHNMTTDVQYNDFVTLNEWINEFWQNKGQFKIHRLMQDEMDDVMNRYGAHTVSISAVLNTENLSPASHLASLIFIPMAPITLYDLFSNTEQTTMETLVIDARDGKVLARDINTYNVADHDALLNAMVYDSYAKAFAGKSNPVGFMGSRFALSGGVNLSMAGLSPIAKGKFVAFTPWANLDFALTRKNTLSVGWAYQSACDAVNNFTRTEDVFASNGSYLGEQEVSYTDQDISKHMTTWSLTLKMYGNTDFAPLGAYGGIGLHLVHFTNPSDGSNGGNTFGMHMSGGRNYVFFNHLLLNIEARYSYTVGLLDLFHGLTDGNDAKLHKADAVLANIIMLRVGIGLMP